MESDIQQYCGREIAGTIDRLYRGICDIDNYFDKRSIIRPPLDGKRVVKPDSGHILKKGSFRTFQSRKFVSS